MQRRAVAESRDERPAVGVAAEQVVQRVQRGVGVLAATARSDSRRTAPRWRATAPLPPQEYFDPSGRP